MYAAGPELRRRPCRAHLQRRRARSCGEDVFGADVANGANQSTIVMATPEAETQFGITADGALSPRASSTRPAGRSAGKRSTASPGEASAAPSPRRPGTPAAPSGIPDGMALRRTIAPGCATLLEASDDRDSSALDFSAVFPNPRPNSVTPSEHACSLRARARPVAARRLRRGGAADQHPRQAAQGHPRPHPDLPLHLRARPARPSSASSTAAASALCRSPFTTAELSFGRHTFRVAARASDGDPRPLPRLATRSSVVKRKPLSGR